MLCMFVFFEWYGDHRELHVLTHSFPTRRSSDLQMPRPIKTVGMHDVTVRLHPEVSVTVQANVARTAEAAEMQAAGRRVPRARSEEHTSELQSLMRTSYAVFCLKNTSSLHITRFCHSSPSQSQPLLTVRAY